MKLISLKLNEEFRSLPKGFSIDFIEFDDCPENFDISELEFSPYVLAGRNGSGKSNVLEVLAAIFHHVDCQYVDFLPESFKHDPDTNPNGFRGEKSTPNSFELEYLIATPDELQEGGADLTAHIRIIKNENKSTQLFWLNNPLYGKELDKSLPKAIANKLLPDAVIGYSSGENEVLSLPFFKMRYVQYDEYMQFLKQDMAYFEESESRLTYLDKEFSQAILLSNLLMQDQSLLAPFATEVGIVDVQQFRIILKRSIWIDDESANEFDSKYLEKEQEGYGYGNYNFKLKILARLQNTIDKLARCATSYYVDETDDVIYLDYLVNNETKKAFENNFKSPVELFEKLNLLLTLNLYDTSEHLKSDLYQSKSLYVSETVPVLASDRRVMRFKDLKLKTNKAKGSVYLKNISDGEHQFLHSLGICMLYSNKNCLFLLDEPDTHFNPSWRAQFISSLKQCFEKVDEDNSVSKKNKTSQQEMLITTHSPFLISDSEEDKVLVFEKSGNDVVVKPPGYTTLGSSINKITIKTFNKKETIGGVAKQKMDQFRSDFSELNTDDQKQELIDKINFKLGDSIEKLMLIKDVLDSMEEDEVQH